MNERSAWTDEEVVEGMRADDHSAYRVYFERFTPALLARAKALGVQSALQKEIVLDTLDDACLRLKRYTAPIPRSLLKYLIISLRHHVVDAARAEQRHYDDATSQRGEICDDRDAAPAGSSEASMRAADPAWSDPPALSPALERLASALDEGLTDEERLLLRWIGDWVPQRIIAEWLGVTHGSIRARILRLRERLRDVAVRHAMRLSPGEQRDLENFFRRTALLRREGSNPPAGTDRLPIDARAADPNRYGTRGPSSRRRASATERDYEEER